MLEDWFPPHICNGPPEHLTLQFESCICWPGLFIQLHLLPFYNSHTCINICIYVMDHYWLVEIVELGDNWLDRIS